MKNRTVTLVFYLMTPLVFFFSACSSSGPDGTDDNSSVTVDSFSKTPEQLVKEAEARQLEKFKKDSADRAQQQAMIDSVRKLKEQRRVDSLESILALEREQLKVQQAQVEQELLKQKQEIDRQNAANAAREAERVRINSSRDIRITMVELRNVISDDEGPNNDADMHKFRFTLNVQQGGCRSGSNPSGNVNGLVLYEYNGPEVTVSEGSVWKDKNKSQIVKFDNEHCDVNSWKLVIDAYALEEDNGSSSADEVATGKWELRGNSAFGTHTFALASSDFKYNCVFRVEKVGW